MRIVSDNTRFNHKPFQGRGASLYVGIGDGPESIRFRRLRLFGGDIIRRPSLSFASGFRKCQFIDQVNDPVASFTYVVQPEWAGHKVWLQVRTFWDHCENVHNFQPLCLDFTEAGEIEIVIHATGKIIRADKRDGGIYRIMSAYYPGTDGTPATHLVLRQTSGPGTLADVSVEIDEDQRRYEHLTATLTDGETYTFSLLAKVGETELQLDTITFTADAEGPPAVSGLTLRPI